MTVGFDNKSINHQLLLSLPFEEATDTLTHDIAKPHHINTLHGTPTWTQIASDLQVLDFDSANPDWLDCPAVDTADLNFTTGDFSLAAWVYACDLLTENRMIFCRGFFEADGWYLAILSNGAIYFITNQLAAYQDTLGIPGAITINTWYLIGATRDGAVARTYANGIDVTDVTSDHINPLTSARELHIGIYDNETGSPFDGYMWNPRIWGRALPADEHMEMFLTERHWFGV